MFIYVTLFSCVFTVDVMRLFMYSIVSYCDAGLFCSEADPCLNGGTCGNNVSQSVCSCPPPYTGDMCETGKLLENPNNHDLKTTRYIRLHSQSTLSVVEYKFMTLLKCL